MAAKVAASTIALNDQVMKLGATDVQRAFELLLARIMILEARETERRAGELRLNDPRNAILVAGL